MKRGWWKLIITGDMEHGHLLDNDLEHIAKQIEEGFTSGEVLLQEGDKND
jgi:hypothetical protein